MRTIETHHASPLTKYGRKKDRTTDLVVSAVVNGFRAIDTGLSSVPTDGLTSADCAIAGQPKHYRYVLR